MNWLANKLRVTEKKLVKKVLFSLLPPYKVDFAKSLKKSDQSNLILPSSYRGSGSEIGLFRTPGIGSQPFKIPGSGSKTLIQRNIVENTNIKWQKKCLTGLDPDLSVSYLDPKHATIMVGIICIDSDLKALWITRTTSTWKAKNGIFL